MGGRYVIYRLKHELEKKLGLLKKKHPNTIELDSISEVEDFRKTIKFDFQFQSNLSLQELNQLKLTAEKILSGQLYIFSSTWINLGNEYDWVTNRDNGYKYNINKHWSEIADLSKEAGDIKYVWEKSRFSWALKLIRYDYYFKKDLSEQVFCEIDSWIENNPINHGPNWRCSQEISLRIFNWYILLSYYKDSKSFTQVRWAKIQKVIYASLHHVYHHIDFSRIAVRNNHAITESLFLALSNILFPFIKETKVWGNKGRNWFEEEIEYQIYPDGTFLQYSMNYHRVVIQLLTLGISLTEKADLPFSNIVYERAYKSLNFLYQCSQEENGWLPNYGSNDGALFFPFTELDYRDFRPQLNSLHYILTGNHLFTFSEVNEETKWWNLIPSKYYSFSSLERKEGFLDFPDGGYVLLRDLDSFTFIRCGSHKDRPAQADNLHLDIWVKGENLLKDSGSYKYNTTQENINYFMGTRSHNSVSVNRESQMLKGSRFIWYYWTQCVSKRIWEDDENYYFEGVIQAFTFLNKNGEHKRKIIKVKGVNKWIVEDKIINLDEYEKEQLWHLGNNNSLNFLSKEEGEKIVPDDDIMSQFSDYYGLKTTGKGLSFKFKQNIRTEITKN
ncbi:heparinase [Sphingobacterium cellulitidis]|uniref:alginate lyase family protein n=1 Tax=Sphingobacterium cellulitidis TaxID=1768011 RepID=UPI000B93F10D|nr:alginate lyase family protein [Sphingobacterium cellulitidis]OYD44533.1 heparinase [Sphingobacterium cellulitidis]